MKYLAQKDGRFSNSLYLAISPDVLAINGINVAFGGTNSTGVPILPIAQSIERSDMEVLYTRTDWFNQ